MTKLQCRKQNGQVFIECPKCRVEQELPLNEDWYAIDHRGQVEPLFVCMAHPDGHYRCLFQDRLWIMNW